MFRPEDQLSAVVRLQAWWRGVHGVRLAAIARVAAKIRCVTERMAAAATCIARHFRGHHVRATYSDQFVDLRRAKYVGLFSNMTKDLQYIVQIQRSFRKKLAARQAVLRRRRVRPAGGRAEVEN